MVGKASHPFSLFAVYIKGGATLMQSKENKKITETTFTESRLQLKTGRSNIG